LPDGYVWSPRPGGTEPFFPTTISRRYGRLAKAAGVESTFHGLRHFHASQLIAAGENVVTVSARLGHASPSITLGVYSHALPARDQDAADRIGEIMRAAKDAKPEPERKLRAV
jgi:integrase